MRHLNLCLNGKNPPEASKILPCRNLKPLIASHLRMSSVEGLWSRPADDPPRAKNRLGQVGPGIEQNQESHTANSCARMYMTGKLGGSKYFITSAGSLCG